MFQLTRVVPRCSWWGINDFAGWLELASHGSVIRQESGLLEVDVLVVIIVGLFVGRLAGLLLAILVAGLLAEVPSSSSSVQSSKDSLPMSYSSGSRS